MTHPNILTQSQIQEMEGLAKTHFLNPNAKRLNKSLGDATGLTGLGVHMVTLDPGIAGSEFHVHYFEDECCYILEGSGEVRLGEQRVAVTVGDFIAHPAGGVAHVVINTGDVPLRMLVVGQRLPQEVVDYPDAGLRLYVQDGMSQVTVPIADLSRVETGRKT